MQAMISLACAARFARATYCRVRRKEGDRIVLSASGTPARCVASADLAEPFNVLDIADVVAFLSAFGVGDPSTDLAAPQGIFDIADIVAFLQIFGAACP